MIKISPETPLQKSINLDLASFHSLTSDQLREEVSANLFTLNRAARQTKVTISQVDSDRYHQQFSNALDKVSTCFLLDSIVAAD